MAEQLEMSITEFEQMCAQTNTTPQTYLSWRNSNRQLHHQHAFELNLIAMNFEEALEHYHHIFKFGNNPWIESLDKLTTAPIVRGYSNKFTADQEITYELSKIIDRFGTREERIANLISGEAKLVVKGLGEREVFKEIARMNKEVPEVAEYLKSDEQQHVKYQRMRLLFDLSNVDLRYKLKMYPDEIREVIDASDFQKAADITREILGAREKGISRREYRHAQETLARGKSEEIKKARQAVIRGRQEWKESKRRVDGL